MLATLTAIASLAAFLFALLLVNCRHLLPLWRSGRQIRLGFPPNRLSRLDIAIVLTVLLGRSVRRSVFSACMRLCGRGVSESPVDASSEHELSLIMPFHITEEDLGSYGAAVGGAGPPDVAWNNVRLIQFLSALTEPAMLLLLARSSCKVRSLGAVNVRNRFELLRPDLFTMQPLASHNGALLTATWSKTVRMVKRGFEIDIEISLDVPSEDSGKLRTAFRQVFTVLQFAKVGSDVSSKSGWEGQPIASTWSEPMPFTIKFNDPTLWAQVCKDYNPIHISTLVAKIFGFPGKIAHGNHLAAKSGLADTLNFRDTTRPLWMEITFKRPVVVPAQLFIRTAKSALRNENSCLISFQVQGATKTFVDGRVGQFKHMETAD